MKRKTWRLITECKKHGCDSLLPFSMTDDAPTFDNELPAIAALTAVQREEIRKQLVNAAWNVPEFERDVKAFDHPLPKEIQSYSLPITCPSCGRMYLYSSADAFLTTE